MIRFIKKLFQRLPVFANVAEGTHAGNVTRELENAVSTRYLLGTVSTDGSRVNICGANDVPLGIIEDTGETGDHINVRLLGVGESTVKMVASSQIQAGLEVYTTSGGRVQRAPAAPGIYYQVGRTITGATGDGDVIEVIPNTPRKLIMNPVPTGDTASTVATIVNAMQDHADKIAFGSHS